MTAFDREAVEKLASKFSNLESFPDAILLYNCGTLLHQYHREQRNNILAQSFEQMIKTIPLQFLETIVTTLEKAFLRLDELVNKHEKIEALQKLSGLLTSSRILCEAVVTLTGLFPYYCDILNESSSEDTELKNSICDILCQLGMYGIISNKNLQREPGDENRLNEIIEKFNEISTDSLSILLGYNHEYSQFSFQDALQLEFPEDSVEKRYLMQMFYYIPSSQTRQYSNNDTDVTNTFQDKEEEEMHDPVQQLHQMFPDFGLGYLETALACYGYNVEEAIPALLVSQENDQEIHPRLRYLDKNLPSLQKTQLKDERYMTPDQEIVQQQKQAWKNMREKQEREDYLFEKALTQTDYDFSHEEERNIYDDDYDDQYDHIDGENACGVALPTSTNYEDDDEKFQAIRVYNKLLRDDEKEDSFWEENRNLNRNPHIAKENDEVDRKPPPKNQDAKPNTTNNRNNQNKKKKQIKNNDKKKENEEEKDEKNQGDNKQQKSKKYYMNQRRYRRNQGYKRTEPTS